MTAVNLTPDDLVPFALIDEDKAEEMISDALALAARYAPCITSEDFAYPDAAKAIIRDAVLRRNDAGTGGITTDTSGPFGVTVDTRQPRRSMFFTSEIAELQSMCKTTRRRGFQIDTFPAA